MTTNEATTEAVWWYECDVLPVVGFVRAPDAESARVAALDDAANRLREYLAASEWRLEPVTATEGTSDAQS